MLEDRYDLAERVASSKALAGQVVAVVLTKHRLQLAVGAEEGNHSSTEEAAAAGVGGDWSSSTVVAAAAGVECCWLTVVVVVEEVEVCLVVWEAEEGWQDAQVVQEAVVQAQNLQAEQVEVAVRVQR